MPKRDNLQSLQEVIGDFFADNPKLKESILEIRIIRGWHTLLGPAIAGYTQNIYMKKRVLYVSLSSSILRNDLLLRKDKLIKDLNDFAREAILEDVVIR